MMSFWRHFLQVHVAIFPQTIQSSSVEVDVAHMCEIFVFQLSCGRWATTTGI